MLAKAFRLRELSWSFAIYAINEPKEKFVSAERRNQHPTRVRSPEELLRWPLIDLLAMPRLRNVLNPWLAGVIH